MEKQAKIGDRVGAILNTDDNGVVYFVGYGVYEGDFAPDLTCSANVLVRLLGEKTPRIRLDNGDIIWGCMCWWLPEAAMQELLGSAASVIQVGPLPAKQEILDITTVIQDREFTAVVAAIDDEYPTIHLLNQFFRFILAENNDDPIFGFSNVASEWLLVLMAHKVIEKVVELWIVQNENEVEATVGLMLPGNKLVIFSAITTLATTT